MDIEGKTGEHVENDISEKSGRPCHADLFCGARGAFYDHVRFVRRICRGKFLALGIEYVIDGIGFLVAVFSAGRTARLMASVRQGDASEKSRKPD